MPYEIKFDALAAPTRREIFEKLRTGPMSVGDIALGMSVSRPAVSQHLKVLKDAGLVTEKRQGVKRIYRLDTEGLSELRVYFDQFWNDAGKTNRS